MKIKNYFLSIIIFILITDLSIILNIPLFRPFLSFICFTLIPGVLIVYALKLNKLEFFKKFVLAIGLSISFLMIVGLLMNEFFIKMGYSKPLSLNIVLSVYNIIMFGLIYYIYNTNKTQLNSIHQLNIKINLEKGQIISPVLLPLIFPFISIFGTQIMNTYGNNILLMILIFFIPIYVALLIYLKKRVPNITYPIAILMISLSMLLIHGLTSNYLNGRDVHFEYITFKIIAANQKWDLLNSFDLTSSTLSVSLLPAIYEILLGINSVYIFKLVFQIICSITPLVCYIIYKDYIKEHYAFLAAFFFISQVVFIFELQSTIKQEIALLFFSLVIMVYLDTQINNFAKKVIFILFMFSMILSHYTTSYIFLYLMLFTWIISISFPWLFGSHKKINFSMLALIFTFIFLWYGSITTQPFYNGVIFIQNTFNNLFSLFLNEIESSQPLRLLGAGRNTLVEKMSTYIHDIGFILITVGVFSLILNRKNQKIDINYTSMTILCFCLLIGLLFIPYLSVGYGSGRLYQQVLVLLAPTLIFGLNFIFNKIHSHRCSIFLVLLLTSQFFCATYFAHEITGLPISEDLNREGNMYWQLYIHDHEISSAKWINMHKSQEQTIYSDFGGDIRLLTSIEDEKDLDIPHSLFKDNSSNSELDGYIYLREFNAVESKIQVNSSYSSIKSMVPYMNSILNKRNKIYSNDGSEIFK